jgi:hypothetical protein
MAAYWMRRLLPVALVAGPAAPFIAAVGRLTSRPCRPLGPVSSISSESMRRAKSQAARPAIAGASILPL